MIKRKIEDRIIQNLIPNKVNLIFGARRVGKTVLMKEIIGKFSGKYLYLNGEDFDSQSLLEPQSVSNYKRLLEGIDLLAIDEAQNIKDIGKKLKLIVDEIEGIRVLASGSSSFDLLNKAGEPLVGRSFNYYLFPFSQSELNQQENALETKRNLDERLLFGSYPEILNLQNTEQKKDYLRDITNAYLLKDILSIDGLKNSKKMTDLLRLIAFQSGNEVSYDELGRQLGLSRNTIEKYLDLLAQVFIVFRMGAYSKNLRKEISKSSKWFLLDTGIRNALISDFSPMNTRKDSGQLWENYILSERIKQNFYQNEHKNFYFWRTYDGQEIDLIEESEGKISALECKLGTKIPRIPQAFKSNYPDAEYSVVNQDNYLDFLI